MLDFTFRISVYYPFTGMDARDAFGGGDIFIPRPLRQSLQNVGPHARAFLIKRLSLHTPHASHHTSVRCPMKGLS